MKTKLTLFVTVLAAALFGMGCVAPIESATGILFPETRKANKQQSHQTVIPFGQNVTTQPDNTHKAFDDITWPKIVLSMEHTNSVSTVTWSPDGKQLATTGGDSTLKIWDGTTGKAIKTIIGPVPELSTSWSPSVCWSPDGRKIVSNSNDPKGHLRMWDVTTGKLIHSIQAHSSYGLGGAWSPNGKYFGSSGGDRAVRVWNAVTGKKVIEMRHSHYAYCMAWSPDGTKIASGSYDKTLRVWDASTGEELNRFKGHTGVIRGFSWSPDGTMLASGGGEGRPTNDRSLRIWDLANNKLIYQVDDAHSGDIARVKWSPDGDKIASTGQGMLKIWDARTGKLLFEQKVPGRDISWHPDSRRLATVYGSTEKPDWTIGIWFIPAKIEPAPTPSEIAIEQTVRKVLGKSSGQLEQADCDQVSELDLSNKNIKDISSLTKFQKLKKLNLRGNPIANFKPLSNLEALEYLFFSTDGVSQSHFGELTFKSVTEIHVERTREMGNGSFISSVVNGSPELKRLHLYLPNFADRSRIFGLKG